MVFEAGVLKEENDLNNFKPYFNQIDMNGDGYISKDELAEFIAICMNNVK